MNGQFHAVLFGTAVGDSLGLPAENLSPERVQRRWPGPWKQRFVFGRGMVSDDTEHTVFVAQCLAEEPEKVEAFQRRLAWKLRWWLLCLPAGIGFATLRAALKLWLGFPPSRSGVYSAGNGPAMRSALIGVYFAENEPRLRDYVRASTQLTHTDPKAETAALAIALTASWAARGLQLKTWNNVAELEHCWLSAGQNDPEGIGLVAKIRHAYDRQFTVSEFAQHLGLSNGVSGYAYHTVPIALYAWLRHFGDYRSGLEAVLNCGGDADTVGAITGALLALNSPIPDEWTARLCDYPISGSYLNHLANALESPLEKPPAFLWFSLPFHNLFFLAVVFAHIARRLFP